MTNAGWRSQIFFSDSTTLQMLKGRVYTHGEIYETRNQCPWAAALPRLYDTLTLYLAQMYRPKRT